MALIAIGGFPGTGKTTICRRLSSDLNLPCLSSDTIGRAITESTGIGDSGIDAFRVAYDVLFRLCEEFVQSSASMILDLTLGWDFHWRRLDEILGRHPRTLFLPVILRCPHEQCIERIRTRYMAMPDVYEEPEYYTGEQRVLEIWDFLQALKRPEIRFVDADREEDQVYHEVKQYVIDRMQRSGGKPGI
jgi:thymidylate kinase